jgi:hypothetical protein
VGKTQRGRGILREARLKAADPLPRASGKRETAQEHEFFRAFEPYWRGSQQCSRGRVVALSRHLSRSFRWLSRAASRRPIATSSTTATFGPSCRTTASSATGLIGASGRPSCGSTCATWRCRRRRSFRESPTKASSSSASSLRARTTSCRRRNRTRLSTRSKKPSYGNGCSKARRTQPIGPTCLSRGRPCPRRGASSGSEIPWTLSSSRPSRGAVPSPRLPPPRRVSFAARASTWSAFPCPQKS